MNRNIKIALTTLCFFSSLSFAQISNECQAEMARASIIYNKCTEMGVSAPEYMECISEYNEQMTKMQQACQVSQVGSAVQPNESLQEKDVSVTQPTAINFSQRPKIAVYVSEYGGYSRDETSALRTATISVLVNSSKYEVIERSNVIGEELKRQASGTIDDDQLTAFGKQSGAQFIVISDMTLVAQGHDEKQRIKHDRNGNAYTERYRVPYKVYQISARMIDVETAEVLAMSTIDRDLTAGGNTMLSAIQEVVGEMLKTVQPRGAVGVSKMAVYIGSSERRRGNKEAALYTNVLNALFTRSRYNKDFKVVERSEAFTRQIAREQKHQQSGHVDNSQIARLGKQYGIERIFIVNSEQAMGTNTISGRLVNVENASIEKMSQMHPLEGDLRGLRQISIQVVENVIPRQISQEEIHEQEYQRNALQEQYDREMKEYMTGWKTLASFGLGGVFGGLNTIDSVNYSAGFLTSLSIERYKANVSGIRFGLNFSLGLYGFDESKIKAKEGIPEAIKFDSDSIGDMATILKGGAFLRLYPADAFYLHGGASIGRYGSYNLDQADGPGSWSGQPTITAVFPVGLGIVLGAGDIKSFYLEGLYNIVQLKDGMGGYFSIMLGGRIGQPKPKMKKLKEQELI